MKKLLLIGAICAVLGASRGGALENAVEQLPLIKKDAGAVRVLGIGNSFTVDALNPFLHELAAAAGREIIVAHLVIGGATLDEHADNAQKNTAAYQYTKIGLDGAASSTANVSIADAIVDEEWDIVCFQQQSWLSGQFDSYQPYLPALVDHVKSKSRNPETVYAILQTWAFADDYSMDDYEYYDNSQTTMYGSLVEAAEKASDLIAPKMSVIPAGTAIQNARTSVLGDTFCADGYHLHPARGRFTVACVWYDAIFGISAVDNPYISPGLPDAEAAIAKKAAHYAIQRPREVTNLAGDR